MGGCERWLIRLASDDDGGDEERGEVTTPYLQLEGRPAADADEPTSLVGGHHWISPRDPWVGPYLFAAVSACAPVLLIFPLSLLL